MNRRHLEVADEFCTLVEANDLFAWLRVPPDEPDLAQEALARERKRLQAMQANPKWAPAARFLIKHYRALEVVVGEPQAHLAHRDRAREDRVLPMLDVAIDGVLADGVLTAEEVAFVRDAAVALGISAERVDTLLQERAQQRGLTVPSDDPSIVIDADEATNDDGMDRGWWDTGFTRTLLDAIPSASRRLVDITCGMAWAAHTVLGHRPELEYLGVDRDKRRLALAQRSLAGTTLANRVGFRRGEPHALPLNDQSVDVVLTVLGLRNVPDTGPVFHEALRVLRPGGRMVVVESDAFGQQFYFDGNLWAFNTAYLRLAVHADRRMAATSEAPGASRRGLSLGPEMAGRLAETGFTVQLPVLHALQTRTRESVHRFTRRLRGHVEAIAQAAGLEPGDLDVRDALAAISVSTEDRSDEVGLAFHLLPAFVTVGIRP